MGSSGSMIALDYEQDGASGYNQNYNQNYQLALGNGNGYGQTFQYQQQQINDDDESDNESSDNEDEEAKAKELLMMVSLLSGLLTEEDGGQSQGGGENAVQLYEKSNCRHGAPTYYSENTIDTHGGGGYSSDSSSEGHIFISYCHANKDLVYKIHQSLKARGYNLWIDTEQMGDNLLDGMSNAVENAWLVLMCVSEQYKNSKNCRKEAEYASHLDKEYIIVKVQPKYKPNEWLGLLLGQKLYYEFGGSTPFDAMIERLIKAIDGVRRRQFPDY